MQTRMAVEEILMSLSELIDTLRPGDEVILTRNQLPVATLLGQPPDQPRPRQPGNCRGMITLLVEDDEHLAGFTDYMP